MDFGNDFISKILDVAQSHAGSILGKLKWKGKSTGIELFDVANPTDFWYELCAKFPSGAFVAPTQNYIGKFQVGPILIEFKYGGNTNPNGYTLEMRYGNLPKIKIRFK